jgi:hypothetical protein
MLGFPQGVWGVTLRCPEASLSQLLGGMNLTQSLLAVNQQAVKHQGDLGGDSLWATNPGRGSGVEKILGNVMEMNGLVLRGKKSSILNTLGVAVNLEGAFENLTEISTNVNPKNDRYAFFLELSQKIQNLLLPASHESHLADSEILPLWEKLQRFYVKQSMPTYIVDTFVSRALSSAKASSPARVPLRELVRSGDVSRTSHPNFLEKILQDNDLETLEISVRVLSDLNGKIYMKILTYLLVVDEQAPKALKRWAKFRNLPVEGHVRQDPKKYFL